MFKEEIAQAGGEFKGGLTAAIAMFGDVMHSFLDRVNGSALKIFGRRVIELEIPPAQAEPITR